MRRTQRSRWKYIGINFGVLWKYWCLFSLSPSVCLILNWMETIILRYGFNSILSVDQDPNSPSESDRLCWLDCLFVYRSLVLFIWCQPMIDSMFVYSLLIECIVITICWLKYYFYCERTCRCVWMNVDWWISILQCSTCVYTIESRREQKNIAIFIYTYRVVLVYRYVSRSFVLCDQLQRRYLA